MNYATSFSPVLAPPTYICPPPGFIAHLLSRGSGNVPAKKAVKRATVGVHVPKAVAKGIDGALRLRPLARAHPPPTDKGFMSTTEYRQLRAQCGFPLTEDQDVCHIIAHANGGANHRDNYCVASRSLNRSLGNKNDFYLAEVVGLEQTKKAVAISRTRGYKGPGADELIAMARMWRMRCARNV